MSTPGDDALCVIDLTGLLPGNADIVCERGHAGPSLTPPPLPIYPLPHQLPEDA